MWFNRETQSIWKYSKYNASWYLTWKKPVLATTDWPSWKSQEKWNYCFISENQMTTSEEISPNFFIYLFINTQKKSRHVVTNKAQKDLKKTFKICPQMHLFQLWNLFSKLKVFLGPIRWRTKLIAYVRNISRNLSHSTENKYLAVLCVQYVSTWWKLWISYHFWKTMIKNIIIN